MKFFCAHFMGRFPLDMRDGLCYKAVAFTSFALVAQG